MDKTNRRRILIMGAAGRDFHNFNVFFRNRPEYDVRAFTATQIPGTGDRRYPAALAGPLYPDGIPIYDEKRLVELIEQEFIQVVVFAYSDVTFQHVMDKASTVLALGADYWLLGTGSTMVRSARPVIAVCAVRTGAGKSQTTRRVVEALRALGRKTCVVRHPMPYGDLAVQEVQRFATLADLKDHKCTLEEREEYEAHIERGTVVYAGVDYEKILRAAEAEADVILWDGGNNDLPFFRPDLHIGVADPLRPGHENTYHPGAAVLRAADCIVINKLDSARPEQVSSVRRSILTYNPRARIIEANSEIIVLSGSAEQIRGRRVLVIEDGPTTTHGEMGYGAGYVAAQRFGARAFVDPRPHATGTIREAFNRYPHVREVLPALGYSGQQLLDFQATLDACDAEVVVSATPIDITRVVNVRQPLVRIGYELKELSRPDIREIVTEFVTRHCG